VSVRERVSARGRQREGERERGGREREREGESDVEGVGAKTRVAGKAEIGRLEQGRRRSAG
jgi:hypothetical protein